MYAETHTNEIQPAFDFAEILPPDAKEVACREWQRLKEDLALIRFQIEELQSKEEALESQVDAWAVILSAGGSEDTCELDFGPGMETAREIRTVPNKLQSADAVVELLRETGAPLHYREIFEQLTARGIEVKGKNPPNTLLARFFDDPRLERVKQGTYQIKVVEEVQPDD